MARARSTRSNNSSANIGFEQKVWLAADKLRSNMDAAEYKHVVLGFRMKYWEIIADNLKKAGWSLGYVSAIDSHGRTIWIADGTSRRRKAFRCAS